mgnify:CR=1 FL=1
MMSLLLDTSKYISDEDLQNIMMFTTPEMLHHLGTAVNEISNDVLRNIENFCSFPFLDCSKCISFPV